MAQQATLDSYEALVTSFAEFLTVAVHTILYERNIYPRTSFLNARKYNYPVRQSRHPQVCKWIQDAVGAVEIEMLKGTVVTTSLVVYTPSSIPLERYTFAPILPPPSTFPDYRYTVPSAPPPGAAQPPLPPSSPGTASSPPSSPPPSPPRNTPISLVDVQEQYRAILSRFSPLPRTLQKIPPDCTFTIAIEVEEGRDAPIGHPQPWIPVEGQQSPAEGSGDDDDDADDRKRVGKGARGKVARTHPIRTLEAGLFTLECWVEESKGKTEVLEEWEREMQSQRDERERKREEEREKMEEEAMEKLMKMGKDAHGGEKPAGKYDQASATSGRGLDDSSAGIPSASFGSTSGPSMAS